MISELVFFVAFLVLLPTIFMSAFAGALAYEWLQYMPPNTVYNAYFGNFSVVAGGLALVNFAFRDKKEKPEATGLTAVFIAYFIWCLITQANSLVGEASAVLFDRAWKVLVITLALSIMMRSRARLEAFLWVLMFAIGNFIVSGAVKTVLSGGGGETVIGSSGNILGERVSFCIAICTMIPIGRFLRDHGTYFENNKRFKRLMDAFTISCLLAVVGTQARTGLVSLAVLAVFYFFKSKNKAVFILVLPFLIGMVIAIAPPQWMERMGAVAAAINLPRAGSIPGPGDGISRYRTRFSAVAITASSCTNTPIRMARNSSRRTIFSSKRLAIMGLSAWVCSC